MGQIKVFENIANVNAWSTNCKKDGFSVGLVPTMGFLHEGHLSLIDRAKEKCTRVVVSVFVNPAQFGEGEDFESYPRNFDKDFELASKRGADAVFFPSAKEIYPENYQTYVDLEKLPDHLCGKSRVGHFKGVATVVSKLFNIVQPDFAFFGEKDFQQLAIIKQMVKDLNFPVTIEGVPIVRESSGLALSSRNSYLSEEERKNAILLYKSILEAEKIIKAGEKKSSKVIEVIKGVIGQYEKSKIDYINICDPETLEDLEFIDRKVVLAMAVFIGKTRLIDNKVIIP
ncbi:MAG: pantoate--beta-alanine ligase [Desulforegulaceae bacterium]|nr:pantoate--beta-alanine ligase [Desulforegulaceae bacterium]